MIKINRSLKILISLLPILIICNAKCSDINKSQKITEKQKELNEELRNEIGIGRTFWAENAIGKGADVNAKYEMFAGDRYNMTPLMLAAYKGRFEIIRMLLRAGAEINAVDKEGKTALMYAINGVKENRTNNINIIINILLSAGINLEVKDKHDKTALIYAKERAYNHIVQLLRNAGAKAHEEERSMSGFGYTPLMVAAINGNIDAVRAILANGANVNARRRISITHTARGKYRSGGGTALMCAASNGHIDVVQLLLDWGADIYLQDEQGDTALMIAARAGRSEIVRLLKVAGDFPINSKQELLITSGVGDIKTLRTLLAKGVDINAKDSSFYFLGFIRGGRTALMLAIKNGHTKFAELLIEKGADVNAKDNIDRTALMLASSALYPQISYS